MFCKNCGANLPDGSKFCAGCGSTVDGATPVKSAKPVSNGVCCPNCNSRNLQATVETNVNVSGGKGYSSAKGCIGFLLLGPLGILCGSCGQKQGTVTTTNKNYYVCGDCGNKFRNILELMKEMQSMHKKGIGCGIAMGVIALFMWIVIIIAMSMDGDVGDVAWLLFTIAISPTAVAVIFFLLGFNAKKEYESLKAKYDKMCNTK